VNNKNAIFRQHYLNRPIKRPMFTDCNHTGKGLSRVVVIVVVVAVVAVVDKTSSQEDGG